MRVDQRKARGGKPPWRDRYLLVASRVRLVVVAVLGVAAAVVVGGITRWWYAPLAGWDVAALVYTGWAWGAIGSFDARRTADHATREDPGRAVTDLLVVAAAVASLGGVGIIVALANSATGAKQDGLAGFGLASVAVSWFTVHTLFTLRYARLYYSGADRGIEFNQNTPPRYLDFAYLAFTIGMTFQVSDTDLQTPAIRANALRHALIAFLLGAVILASTINLLSGLGGKGGG
ncbi:MAG: DUF1345 domain-containing protein [Actinobacteria bacterium]|nr:DUF1345 domain-containing protein [Actinomycetota bacterium]